jgi:metal-responsive CopG/Arc/MetJ family transcriptional regulator
MNMAVAKVALSLPASLLTQVDRMARKSGVTRSAFVRQAVERSLRQSGESEVVRKAHAIYAEIGEEDRALAEAFLHLAAETLPAPSRRRKR